MIMLSHPFQPVCDENSRILILGSFPSAKSREQMFYYGHPRNRFWKMLAVVLCESEPVVIEDKKRLLLSHGIALWDVAASCKITGSADSSIQNVVANDIPSLVAKYKINRILCNGATAFNLYMKLVFPTCSIHPVRMPSTSPANASFSLESLIEVWRLEISK